MLNVVLTWLAVSDDGCGMDRATLEAHPDRAVAEPQPAPEPGPGALLAQELALDAHLRGLARGRLEQEFLNPARVAQALTGWAA